MAGNAKCTSPTFQNEILRIAISMEVEEIVIEANESFLSVVADESCDYHSKESIEIFPYFVASLRRQKFYKVLYFHRYYINMPL